MIPRLLQVVGFLLIGVGVIIGINSYEIPETALTEAETSFTILFSWIAAGVFAGLTLIGLGEIIHKQEEANKIASKALEVKNKEFTA